MLLAGKASLLSKTIVSVPIEFVWILVMGWIVRDGFDWTTNKSTFGNDCAVGEPEVLEKDTLTESWGAIRTLVSVVCRY